MTPSPDPSERPEFSPAERAFLDALRGQLEVQDLELRAHPRFDLDLEVSLSTIEGLVFEGRTIDIARGGLRGRFDVAPTLGNHYGVRVLGLDREPTLTLGRCLRVELLEDGSCEVVLHFSRPIRRGTQLG